MEGNKVMNPVLRERMEKHHRLMATNNDCTMTKEHSNLRAWGVINGYSVEDIEAAKVVINASS